MSVVLSFVFFSPQFFHSPHKCLPIEYTGFFGCDSQYFYIYTNVKCCDFGDDKKNLSMLEVDYARVRQRGANFKIHSKCSFSSSLFSIFPSGDLKNNLKNCFFKD